MTLSLPRTALSLAELDDLDHEGVVRFVRRLEEYGHRMVWLPEINGREAFTTAALVLASTERLVVGNGVARALERVPKSAGSAARGLAEGYPGRYVLGLGVSGAVRARGTGPLPFLREYLDGVDKVAAGVPRVLGAYSPGITRLAAERADGLITFLVPPEHTRWARETVGPDLFLSVVQWAVVGRDRAAAREVAHAAPGLLPDAAAPDREADAARVHRRRPGAARVGPAGRRARRRAAPRSRCARRCGGSTTRARPRWPSASSARSTTPSSTPTGPSPIRRTDACS